VTADARVWRPRFLAALELERGNVAAAARRTGIARTHVYFVRARDPEFRGAFEEITARYPARRGRAESLVAYQKARGAEHRARVEALWAEGKTPAEIGGGMGWTHKHAASIISMQRTQRGYEHEHRLSPEHIEGLRATAPRRMAAARAARP
jgi:hypothetical protein